MKEVPYIVIHMNNDWGLWTSAKCQSALWKFVNVYVFILTQSKHHSPKILGEHLHGWEMCLSLTFGSHRNVCVVFWGSNSVWLRSERIGLSLELYLPWRLHSTLGNLYVSMSLKIQTSTLCVCWLAHLCFTLLVTLVLWFKPKKAPFIHLHSKQCWVVLTQI